VLRFQFQYPAVYTMVIRALGSLEGTATALDPSFKVLASAYPFVVGRLLADPTPEVRCGVPVLFFVWSWPSSWFSMEEGR
jgi:aarF domain-containing kinase